LGQDAQDPDILEYAFQNGYTILTHDKKIQTHINDRIAEGKNHCGVFIALDNLQGDRGVGRIVAEVTFWHDAIQSGAASLQEEVYNQVIWIS